MFTFNAPVLAGLSFTAFALWLLCHALGNYRNAQASRHWPSVNGRLSNIKLWGTRNISGEIKEVEKLSVEYVFNVEGTNYTGTTVAFYTLVYPETLEFFEKHPLNANVAVYYKPQKPAESVLVPGLKKGNKRYGDIVLAAVGLAVSVAITIAGLVGVVN